MQGYVHLMVLLFGLAASWLPSAFAGEKVKVLMKTNLGDIVLELDGDKAPKTVDNFVAYVKDGFYDGTIFHRVIPDFMIQGGGFTAEMERKQTRAPIPNEADNGLKNDRGTIAMARTSDPHSATAQFFINLKDNDFLNFRSKDVRGWGYAVFGRVVQGMDVVDKIAAQPTQSLSNGMRNVPVKAVVIEKVVALGGDSEKGK